MNNVKPRSIMCRMFSMTLSGWLRSDEGRSEVLLVEIEARLVGRRIFLIVLSSEGAQVLGQHWRSAVEHSC
jgi:hypothetical protein